MIKNRENGGNEFKYIPELVDEAINCVKNVTPIVTSLKQNINNVKNMKFNVNVKGLEFLDDDNINENLSTIMDYESVIQNMKQEAELNNFEFEIDFQNKDEIKNIIDKFVDGEITSEQFISISNRYMHYLLENDIMYYNNLPKTYTVTPIGIQLANTLGIRKPEEQQELIDNINIGMAKYLINNDYMYTRTGVIEYVNSYNGMLAMFGYRMGYANKEFDQPQQGLYLGTRMQKLSVVDCCNLYDWAGRAVGIDLHAFGAGTHYNYAKDIDGTINSTPENEIKVYYGDKYFKNAKPGDIIEKSYYDDPGSGHLRIIIGKDENGYYTVENGSGMEYKYYTFEELNNTGYHISNMDAVYKNTTCGNTLAYDYNKNHWNQIEVSASEAEKVRADYENGQIFLTPKVFAEELNLEEQYVNRIAEQYTKRNQRQTTMNSIEFDINSLNDFSER